MSFGLFHSDEVFGVAPCTHNHLVNSVRTSSMMYSIGARRPLLLRCWRLCFPPILLRRKARIICAQHQPPSPRGCVYGSNEVGGRVLRRLSPKLTRGQRVNASLSSSWLNESPMSAFKSSPTHFNIPDPTNRFVGGVGGVRGLGRGGGTS